MDVLARRQIHHRVRTPLRRPPHFLNFFFNTRRDGAIADIRINLHEEVPPDDHRLGLRMIDVGGNDRPTARHFTADKLGFEPLTDSDEFHLRRDDPLSRIMKLADSLTRLRPQRLPSQADRNLAVTSPSNRLVRRCSLLNITTTTNPFTPQRRQTTLDIPVKRRITPRTA